MTIKVDIIADSLSPAGARITTMACTYPRFLHAEVLTHRVFSRNASSSRAIPTSRLIDMVRNDPAIPQTWYANKAGMQGGDELSLEVALRCDAAWRVSMRKAIWTAEYLANMGVHKQHVNRVLEPYAHMHTLITSTQWRNFFALRAHPDAQPELAILASAMRDAMEQSYPKVCDLHLPYITQEDKLAHDRETLLKVSAARCARVSYVKHNGQTPSVEDDLKLYARLMDRMPKHASPTEHQAWAAEDPTTRSGNFTGWIQHRQTIPGHDYDQTPA